MTNEEFQKALSLVRQAFKSGAVQWRTMDDCDFSDEKPDAVHVSLHPTVKYRIKPRPREVWVVFQGNLPNWVGLSAPDQMRVGDHMIRFREATADRLGRAEFEWKRAAAEFYDAWLAYYREKYAREEATNPPGPSEDMG